MVCAYAELNGRLKYEKYIFFGLILLLNYFFFCAPGFCWLVNTPELGKIHWVSLVSFCWLLNTRAVLVCVFILISCTCHDCGRVCLCIMFLVMHGFFSLYVYQDLINLKFLHKDRLWCSFLCVLDSLWLLLILQNVKSVTVHSLCTVSICT